MSLCNKQNLKQHLRLSLLKKLSNTEAEFKKGVAYKKKRVKVKTTQLYSGRLRIFNLYKLTTRFSRLASTFQLSCFKVLKFSLNFKYCHT